MMKKMKITIVILPKYGFFKRYTKEDLEQIKEMMECGYRIYDETFWDRYWIKEAKEK